MTASITKLVSDGLSTVVWEDRGVERLQETLAELKKLKVRIGYQDAEGKEVHPGSTIKVAHLAAIMEFGWPARDIPARSFMRSTVEEHQSDIKAFEERQLKRIVAEAVTPIEGLSEIGRYICGLIRQKLDTASSWAEPLDPKTAEKKGHGKVLDNTGTLKSNLGWRVSSGRQVFARGK